VFRSLLRPEGSVNPPDRKHLTTGPLGPMAQHNCAIDHETEIADKRAPADRGRPR
jgi:hypothetical protein